MKSFFRNLSVVTAVFIVALVLVSSVSAQTASTTVNQLTSAELADLNNLPSIGITGLKFDRAEYKTGDTVTGSFLIKNDRSYTLPDLYYKISLIGEYGKNGLANAYYDGQRFGPLFLEANGTNSVTFSYVLPKFITGSNLGIEVRGYTSSGSPLAGTNSSVKIIGTGSGLSVTSAFVTIDGQDFSIQAGPTLKAGGTGVATIKIQNSNGQPVTIVPEVQIYDRTVLGKLLKTQKLESVIVPTKGSSIVKITLDSLNSRAGVYESMVNFLGVDGSKITSSVQYRYIVSGQVATIQYVSADKYSVSKRDNFMIKIGYSGTPTDITNPQVSSTTSLNLSLKVLNENGKTVAEYSGKQDFDKGLSVEFPLVAKTSARTLAVKIEVTDNTGKIVTTYDNTITGQTGNADESEDGGWLTTNTIAVVVIILLIIVAFLVFKKRKSAMMLVILFTALFGFSSIASANVFKYAGTQEVIPSLVPGITVDTPGDSMAPGQPFKVTGIITNNSCTNSVQNITGYWTTIMPASATSTFNYDGSYSYDGSINNWDKFKDGEHAGITYSNNYSLTANGADFVAPTQAGEYVIFAKVVISTFYPLFNGWIETSTWGYIPFSVPPPPPTNLTLSCPTGTVVNATWTAPAGYNTFNLRANPGSGSNLTFPSAVVQNDVTGFSSSFPSTPNQTYFVWVETMFDSLNSWPNIVSGNITCPAATYTLTTNAVNGTVTKSPNQASYAPGTVVTLTATSTGSYNFTGWSGDLTGSTNPTTITMSSDKTVTAAFNSSVVAPLTASCRATATNGGEAPSTITWSVYNVSGGNGSYTYLWSNGATGTGVSATTQADAPGTYTATVRVRDTATPTPHEVSVVCEGTATEDGGSSGGGGKPITDGVVSKNLTLTINGSGTGTINGFAAPGYTRSFPAGSSVTLTPTSGANSKPVVWGAGDCSSVAVGSACALNMDTNKIVTATFDLNNPNSITCVPTNAWVEGSGRVNNPVIFTAPTNLIDCTGGCTYKWGEGGTTLGSTNPFTTLFGTEGLKTIDFEVTNNLGFTASCKPTAKITFNGGDIHEK